MFGEVNSEKENTICKRFSLAKLNAEWYEMDAMLVKLKMPFFRTPGNHDIANPTTRFLPGTCITTITTTSMVTSTSRWVPKGLPYTRKVPETWITSCG